MISKVGAVDDYICSYRIFTTNWTQSVVFRIIRFCYGNYYVCLHSEDAKNINVETAINNLKKQNLKLFKKLLKQEKLKEIKGGNYVCFQTAYGRVPRYLNQPNFYFRNFNDLKENILKRQDIKICLT